MRIGETAKRAGVGVETIRFYELKGLIDQPPTPRSGGYTEYCSQDVRRILFIRRAQQLGFALGEMADLLALKIGSTAQCADVRERASTKLGEVNAKIDNLGKIKTQSCPSCDVQVPDMKSADVARQALDLCISLVPAVVIGGKLADCCASRSINLDVLAANGPGRPIE